MAVVDPRLVAVLRAQQDGRGIVQVLITPCDHAAVTLNDDVAVSLEIV